MLEDRFLCFLGFVFAVSVREKLFVFFLYFVFVLFYVIMVGEGDQPLLKRKGFVFMFVLFCICVLLYLYLYLLHKLCYPTIRIRSTWS